MLLVLSAVALVLFVLNEVRMHRRRLDSIEEMRRTSSERRDRVGP